MFQIQMMGQGSSAGVEKTTIVTNDITIGFWALFTAGDMMFKMLGRLESGLLTELTLLIHDEQT